MVATLSVSVTGTSYSLNAAIADLRAVGVPSVVAAGNANKNACAVTPANAPGAVTVGASTIGALDPVTAMIAGNADLDFVAAYGGGLYATRASISPFAPNIHAFLHKPWLPEPPLPSNRQQPP